MPPRLPHGLKKNPIHMNSSEKAVFAMLTASIGAGLIHLATSPLWSKPDPESQPASDEDQKDKNGKQKPYIFQM